MHDCNTLLGWRMEFLGSRGECKACLVSWPEPDCTPFVHCSMQMLRGVTMFNVFSVVPFSLIRIVDWQLVQFLVFGTSFGHHRIGRGGFFREQRRHGAEPTLDDLPHFSLDATIARATVADLFAPEQFLNSLRSGSVLAVAAFSLPCLERIVQHPVQPATHQ